MAYRIEILNAAKSEIRKLEDSHRKRIVAKIEKLAQNPRPAGVLKLAGLDDLYRVRVGDFRIIYRIDDRVLVVLIVRVADRKDVYD